MNFTPRNLFIPFRIGRNFLWLLFVCGTTFLMKAQTITSPNKNLSLEFELKENGAPSYQLS